MPGVVGIRLASLTLAAMFIVVLLGAGRQARAELPRRKTKRVAVLPPRVLTSGCYQLFSNEKSDLGWARRLTGKVAESLAGQTDIKVREFVSLRGKVSGKSSYRDKMVVGRERYLLGKELYRDLRQNEAEESLRRSVDLLDSVFYDVVEPEEHSDVLLLLGVTLMEGGRTAQAHGAFKRALSLYPTMRIPKGHYAEPIEKALLVACVDLRQSMEKEIPLSNVERTVAFMSKHKLDSLFFPVFIKENGKKTMLLVVFERTTRSLAFRDEIPVADEEADTLARIDRSVSRWATCTPFKSPTRRVEERHRYVLSAAYQHLAYLVYPTRSLLHTMGFSFEGDFFFLDSFALVGKMQLMSSMPDRFNDMLEGFTSARLIFGPAFSVSGTWWRLYVVPGAELHYIGSFSVTRDADCKHFLNDSPGYQTMCKPENIKEFPVEFLGGINVYMGSQFFFANKLFLGLGASVSTYFVPFNRSFDMNFPVSAEIGGGIAF